MNDLLVIDAELWPNGDRGDSEPLGRIGIARVATSTGGDLADCLVVHLRGCVVEARLLRRCHVMSGWRAILSTALELNAGSPVELDDPRVLQVEAALLGSTQEGDENEDLTAGRDYLETGAVAATLPDADPTDRTEQDLAALLLELAHQRGMSWADIALAAGASVSAVREWRMGGVATAEHRRRLAQCATFLDLLEERGVEDPAQWMETPLPLPDGYQVRPVDLYADGQDIALLNIAENRRSAEEVLDEVRPGWREQRSDYEVFVDTDVQRSIRRRDE